MAPWMQEALHLVLVAVGCITAEQDLRLPLPACARCQLICKASKQADLQDVAERRVGLAMQEAPHLLLASSLLNKAWLRTCLHARHLKDCNLQSLVRSA